MQAVGNESSVSTLMDGELDADEAAREIARLKQDDARRDAWNTYHAIGDALRGEHAPAGLSADFSRRLSERLALEPTVVAPHRRAPRTIQTWALSAAASVAAVAAVGWATLNMMNADVAPGTLATAPAAKVANGSNVTQGAKSPVVALPPAGPARIEPLAAAPEHMHEYLLAHQGISPSTAIQGVTPYIRTVSNAGNEPGLR
jgi:sigma-E factor negative regulatory protein RseA